MAKAWRCAVATRARRHQDATRERPRGLAPPSVGVGASIRGGWRLHPWGLAPSSVGGGAFIRGGWRLQTRDRDERASVGVGDFRPQTRDRDAAPPLLHRCSLGAGGGFKRDRDARREAPPRAPRPGSWWRLHNADGTRDMPLEQASSPPSAVERRGGNAPPKILLVTLTLRSSRP